jgi:hypothetical protein
LASAFFCEWKKNMCIARHFSIMETFYAKKRCLLAEERPHTLDHHYIKGALL